MPKFGRFELRELLSAGAFGEVWRAWDPNRREEVALKRLVPSLAIDPDTREQFLVEASKV